METTQLSVESCDCEPFVYMPAWWSSFLFQIISPRQLAVYTYIAMLGVPDGFSTPTIRQIQQDMGLSSDSMVYEALRALEDSGLIRRVRVRSNGSPAQNGYRRPACESTLITLLEAGRIDHRLRPIDHVPQTKSDDVTELVREGLAGLLGERFPQYQAAPAGDRRGVLLDLLRASLAERSRRENCTCAFSSDGDDA